MMTTFECEFVIKTHALLRAAKQILKVPHIATYLSRYDAAASEALKGLEAAINDFDDQTLEVTEDL